MNETNNSDKTVWRRPRRRRRLHLKRPVEQGTVRQSFSHGRSKAVVVEKVKRRVLGPGEAPPPAPPPAPASKTDLADPVRRPAPGAPAAPARPTPPPQDRRRPADADQEQREARARALIDARAREEEDRRRQEARGRGAPRARGARARRARGRRSAQARGRTAPRAGGQFQAPVRGRGAPPPRRRRARARRRPVPRKPSALLPQPRVGAGRPRRPAGEEESARVARRAGAHAPWLPQKVVVPTPRPTRSGEQRNRGRLTVTSATSAEEERTRSVASFRRRTQRLKGHGAQDQKEKIAREIVLPETITIQELASRMSERAVDVIKLLMRQGRMVTLTDVLDADTAQLIAEEMGHTVKRVAEFRRRGRPVRPRPTRTARPCRARRSSRSWATSTTARRRCSTPSATPMWSRAKPAASPSISAPIRSLRPAARRSPSSTRPATRPSPRCARAAPR